MIDPTLLGALLALSAVLLVLVVLFVAAAVWLGGRFARFREVSLKRTEELGQKRVYLNGSFEE